MSTISMPPRACYDALDVLVFQSTQGMPSAQNKPSFLGETDNPTVYVCEYESSGVQPPDPDPFDYVWGRAVAGVFDNTTLSPVWPAASRESDDGRYDVYNLINYFGETGVSVPLKSFIQIVPASGLPNDSYNGDDDDDSDDDDDDNDDDDDDMGDDDDDDDDDDGGCGCS
jgi:hypothetical protein